MNFLILFITIIIFTFGILTIHDNAFGISECKDTKCRAFIQYDNTVQGLQYDLDSPDLWMAPTGASSAIPSCNNNTAVSTGWLITHQELGMQNEWMEGGVRKGHVEDYGCNTELRTYYAYNDAIHNMITYTENNVLNGRVDPGDAVEITIEEYGSGLQNIWR